MTKEEKQLLLQDLCARLPYHTIISVDNGKYREDVELKPFLINDFNNWGAKPYLRPISSMTEKERDEFDEFTFEVVSFNGQVIEAYQLLDWLNSHHFDYRGLIEKGLALEAPEGMYN